MMKVQHFITDFFDTNVYLFTKNGKRFMVDCGGTPEDTRRHLEELGFWPDYLLLTHGHIDHISSLALFQDSDVQIFLHPEEKKYLLDPGFNLSDRLLGRSITFDLTLNDSSLLAEKFGIQTLHTPGHSPGSVCYLIDDVLFSGDTLFCRGIGNTSFPGGDLNLEMQSVRSLLQLREDLIVYPGHGPFTSISQERNSF